MRRLLSWIILGLCVFGAPIVIFVAYSLFNMFAYWLIGFMPFLEYADDMFGAASGFMAIMIAGALSLLSLNISVWLSVSETGRRYFVFGILGFALAAAGLIWCAVSYFHAFSGLSWSWLKGFGLDPRAVADEIFGYRVNVWRIGCTLVNQCFVSGLIMTEGETMNTEKREAAKCRVIFYSFSDSNDGSLYPFACIAGESVPLLKNGSLDNSKLNEYSNSALKVWPELKEFAILIGEAVSPTEVKCVHAIKARKWGEHYYDYDIGTLSALRNTFTDIEGIPEVKLETQRLTYRATKRKNKKER